MEHNTTITNNTNSSNIEELVQLYGSDCMYDLPLLDEPYVKYPLMSIYIFVFLLCFLGNIFTMLVICTHPQMRTATNFFLANLAAADLLVAVFCILQNMIHIVGFDHAVWPLGSALCKMYLLIIHLVPCASVAILVAVSFEKYLAVLHPLTALKMLTHRLRVAVTVAIWLVSLLMNLPHFYTAKHMIFSEKASACTRESLPIWITISFFVWYVLPLCTLAYIYCRIGLLLWKTGSLSSSTRRSSDSQSGGGTSWQMVNGRMVAYKQESLLQVPNGSADRKQQQRRRQKDVEGRRKVVRLLFTVVLSFAILSFPNHVRVMIATWSTSVHCPNSLWSLLQPLSYISLFVSSAINPILYALLSRRFREAAIEIFVCRKGILCDIISRTRNRTIISDIPEDSRCPSPVRMYRIR